MRLFPSRTAGFTLVELMIALVLTSVAAIGIYRSFVTLSTASDIEEQTIEMQQNLRIGMNRMVKELRMAGYRFSTSAPTFGFTGAAATTLSFTTNTNEDNVVDPDEIIAYQLDTSEKALKRQTNGGYWWPVISNVDALDFVYLNSSGAVISNPGANLGQIFRVQIALVVRTGNEDYSYRNFDSYQNLQGAVIYTATGDNFRRRLMTAEVTCYNLGPW